MDLSRLEAGQEQLQLDSVDAATLLREMIANVQPMATERGIVLWADGPDTLPVKTDRVKFQRIVQNLLLNAINYTRPVPERPAMVSISWSTEGDYRWTFRIRVLVCPIRSLAYWASSFGQPSSRPMCWAPSRANR